nr:uncharacterized protein LOC115131956 isoform X3 [Oncorhynchus nerka]
MQKRSSRNTHSSLMSRPDGNIQRWRDSWSSIQRSKQHPWTPRLRKAMTKDNLDRLKDEDFHKAEEFVQLMGILYTSTLCVSCDKNATCGQLIPILHKLEEHFTVKIQRLWQPSKRRCGRTSPSAIRMSTFKPSCMRPQQWTPDLKGGR